MKKEYLYIFFLPLLLLSCEQNYKQDIKHKLNFDTTFNSNLWLNGNLYLKGRMTNDLIERNVLKSYSLDSLLITLGEPSEKDKEFWTYLISNEDTISISQNYSLLHIEIDTLKSRVKDYWLTD